jgi:hypothetical protein
MDKTDAERKYLSILRLLLVAAAEDFTVSSASQWLVTSTLSEENDKGYNIGNLGVAIPVLEVFKQESSPTMQLARFYGSTTHYAKDDQRILATGRSGPLAFREPGDDAHVCSRQPA